MGPLLPFSTLSDNAVAPWGGSDTGERGEIDQTTLSKRNLTSFTVEWQRQ